MSRLIKTKRGNTVRLHIWGAFWDGYDFPQIHLTRKEAQKAADTIHVIGGFVKKVIVEWEEKQK